MANEQPSIYVMKFASDDRMAEIISAADRHGWVTEAIADFRTAGLGRIYAGVLIRADGEIFKLARLTRLRTAALNQRTVGLSDLEALSEKDCAVLKQAILASVQTAKKSPRDLTEVNRLTADQNKKLIEQLDNIAPSVSDRLREKGKFDDRILSIYTQHEQEIIGLERDVVGISLEIAFGDRENLVLKDELMIGASTEKQSSFLGMLEGTGYTEDEIIAYEMRRFDGLRLLRELNPRAVEFEQNGSVLRVIHANRNKLENTLGVDLIYVSEYFGSIVGVQYKMMRGDFSSAHFTPDENFIKQLRTMDDTWRRIPFSPIVSQNDYRLNQLPFYFKFISKIEKNFGDDTLCRGMYMPSDLVSQLCNSTPQEKIGTKHQTRYLTNTDFSSLVRHGWIGTSFNQRTVLEELTRQTINSRKSLIVAVQSENSPGDTGPGFS